MTGIRSAPSPTAPPSPPVPPHVVVRVGVTTDSSTTRTDLVLRGSRGTYRSPDGVVREFPTARVWDVVRGLLPDVLPATAPPAVSRREDLRPADPDALAACRHVVATSVGTRGAPGADALALRTWMLSDTHLHRVAADPAGADDRTTVLTERHGALAATLQWDVAGAMDHLARALAGRAA